MKITKIHARTTKIFKTNYRIPNEKHENLLNLNRIQREDHENYENLKIQHAKDENHENRKFQ